MDTLTQITLGAAAGQAVLGRKIGNRAMAWGAFGGLLPDLDVAANLFTDEITALAFHRGIMHSLFFSVFAAIGMGWLVEWLHRKGHYNHRWYKRLVFGFLVFLLLLIAATLNYVVYSPREGLYMPMLAVTVIVSLLTIGWGWKKLYITEWQPAFATRMDWIWLFFWSIFTHIALDCFTSYGTQIFQPFSNYAVAFSTVSVIDPLYTVPFLLCVILVLSLRENRLRQLFNWLGIGISSAYLALTLYHKWQVDTIFKDALQEKNIVTERFTTAPTLFNNYLWQGVAEGKDAYYHAKFSLLDTPPYIPEFNVLEKNHALLAPFESDKTIRILKWFPKGYFNVIPIGGEKLQLNDLRYGSTGDTFRSREDYVFRFILEEKNGHLEAKQQRAYHKLSWEGMKRLFWRAMGKNVTPVPHPQSTSGTFHSSTSGKRKTS